MKYTFSYYLKWRWKSDIPSIRWERRSVTIESEELPNWKLLVKEAKRKHFFLRVPVQFQLEDGDYPTSYIQTGYDCTVTRPSGGYNIIDGTLLTEPPRTNFITNEK